MRVYTLQHANTRIFALSTLKYAYLRAAGIHIYAFTHTAWRITQVWPYPIRAGVFFSGMEAGR